MTTVTNIQTEQLKGALSGYRAALQNQSKDTLIILARKYELTVDGKKINKTTATKEQIMQVLVQHEEERLLSIEQPVEALPEPVIEEVIPVIAFDDVADWQTFVDTTKQFLASVDVEPADHQVIEVKALQTRILPQSYHIHVHNDGTPGGVEVYLQGQFLESVDSVGAARRFIGKHAPRPLPAGFELKAEQGRWFVYQNGEKVLEDDTLYLSRAKYNQAERLVLRMATAQ